MFKIPMHNTVDLRCRKSTNALCLLYIVSVQYEPMTAVDESYFSFPENERLLSAINLVESSA